MAPRRRKVGIYWALYRHKIRSAKILQLLQVVEGRYDPETVAGLVWRFFHSMFFRDTPPTTSKRARPRNSTSVEGIPDARV
jgi:hypothetical protein